MNDDEIELSLPYVRRNNAGDVEVTRRHPYFSADSALLLRRLLVHWQDKNNFRAAATIEPSRYKGMTISTLYQKFYHGRLWGVNNFALDDPFMHHFKCLRISKVGVYLKLTYQSTKYIVDDLLDAVEFGETSIDVQQKFIDWTESDPQDMAQWPEEDIILEPEDVKFFEHAAAQFREMSPPRFAVRVTGTRVHVMSIKQAL